MTSSKQSRQNRLINKFLKIFLLSFAVFVLIAALGTFAYVQIASNNILKKLSENPILVNNMGTDEDAKFETENTSEIHKKTITTIAILGVDKDGYRTDVTMIAFFNHKTHEIDVVSIPRDTQVMIPDELYAEITASRSDVKQNERINTIPAYVSSKRRNEASVAVLENAFGVKIDYFVNMDLDGFKSIVDAIGPIYVDVPQDMKYTDVLQDPPLIIDLKAGYQGLNGSQAEQLIRFRYGYSDADLGRIKTQHLFMKAFVEQLLKPDKLFNIVSIVESVLLYVTTDFSDAVDYLIYVDKLSADKITMVTLPGSGSGNDGSFIYDVEATKLLFEGILNKVNVDDATNENASNEGTTDSETGVNGSGDSQTGSTDQGTGVIITPLPTINAKDYVILVLNGTYTAGLAKTKKLMLEAEGYTVEEPGNYDNKPIDRTIITVPYQVVGDELSKFFDNPKVVVEESLKDETVSVIIAIGSNDSN
jgi:polyisoprenyl-teichoic acid--peptidoglycan teichoic acid transferase